MVPPTGGEDEEEHVAATVNVSVSAFSLSLLSSRDSSTVPVRFMGEYRTCDRDWHVHANVIPPLRPVESKTCPVMM